MRKQLITPYRILSILACMLVQSVYAQKTVTIAISKCHNEADTLWLRHFNKDVQFVNLYGLSYVEALQRIQQCNALLLTGGEDINPVYYGEGDQMERCGKPDCYRDTLEMAVLHAAMKRKIPILGICRGSQLINVANKGSLVIDIPHDVPGALQHDSENSEPALHEVKLVKDTKLSAYIKDTAGVVNSFHHQCVHATAPGFRVAARAGDGVPEAIETTDNSIFLLGVQWHPERMDYNSPFSSGIAHAFLGAIGVSNP